MCTSKVQYVMRRKTGCNRSKPVFFGFYIFTKTWQLATGLITNVGNWQLEKTGLWFSPVQSYTGPANTKWKQFGLWLHLGFDPYPGELQWLKVSWLNCNPQLIGSYYLEAARKKESDPRWEIFTLRYETPYSITGVSESLT
ncbi:uncharacterized protein LACBIDRAFT_323311 [Laccaria bicolor S238N-H82]|uniref:Predicted protein n=1 Tax=Laccaria bicolor (strain S238N-H82 / ATCC MYA-4686) TaxID=486041 RepID=B0CZT8_LACBS|nr:uncharacterized protein LACBIDRAFT_323311 [Laccaria bicolor S238N-H82]EDR12673.1 predicted protein [Laccaria bicolor S238N-H82]|eukprot:XP_001876937.1 predicted protein [Laccaria bicolor S238N-H82]